MIRIVVVEDSDFQREALVRGFSKETGMKVLADVATGEECLKVVPFLRPDAVVVDGQLPDMPGPEVIESLLEIYPIPIILYTAKPEEYEAKAERSGAVAVVSKKEDFSSSFAELVRTIRLMKGLTVIRRRNYAEQREKRRDYLLIASSSGGPRGVEQILSRLNPRAGVTVVIVQHLTKEGVPGFMSWLESVTSWKCKLVESNTRPRAGTVYIGTAGNQLLFDGSELSLGKVAESDNFAPSANKLFSSFARHKGSQSVGVVLSGMGDDGARGLLELRMAGALTLVEDPQTAAVAGMPQSAVDIGAAAHIVPSNRLGESVARLLRNSRV
jgi:two-component system, chemotaxis family, protein-glutamate methylesterase/glutaminase